MLTLRRADNHYGSNRLVLEMNDTYIGGPEIPPYQHHIIQYIVKSRSGYMIMEALQSMFKAPYLHGTEDDTYFMFFRVSADEAKTLQDKSTFLLVKLLPSDSKQYIEIATHKLRPDDQIICAKNFMRPGEDVYAPVARPFMLKMLRCEHDIIIDFGGTPYNSVVSIELFISNPRWEELRNSTAIMIAQKWLEENFTSSLSDLYAD